MDLPFRPALLVVDLQNDFCPPDGSLAVPNGRDVVGPVNSLLDLPFVLKIATKDWHPVDHISFASNHPPPDNEAFVSTISIANPQNPAETIQSRLWPVHCVQDSPGADLVQDLAVQKVDHVVKKGQDARVEMYSAVRDPYRHPPGNWSGLAELLKHSDISHVYVVGLAMDYCVKHSALDCRDLGYSTYVVRECTRAVDAGEQGWGLAQKELELAGVKLISVNGPEVKRVQDMHRAG